MTTDGRLAAGAQTRQPPGCVLPHGAKVAVVQPLPGIGDMIWHLPHLRAIAAAIGRPITLLTKPRSQADQLLAGEASIAGILWLPGRAAGGRGLGGLGRVIGELAAGRFDAIVLLHHSRTLALAAALAGIRMRLGYGAGAQRLWLSGRPFLSPAARRLHPYEQASAWLAAAGIAVGETEPVLAVADAASASVRARLAPGFVAPGFVVLGIGSSEPYKQWGAANFAALIALLREAGRPRMVLLGGPGEAALAADIQSRLGAAAAAAIGWPLGEVAALLAMAACYIGNDTGTANLAAAVGTTTFCLFGATEPLAHSARIVPIVPPGGIDRTDGMARITPAAVMAAMSP